MRGRAPLLSGFLLLAAGCIPSTGPPVDCEATAVEVAVALSGESMDPGSVAACRDQEVTLVVGSEVDGVVHIHGYDSELPAFEVGAGDPVEVTFTAGRSGQFPVEFHASSDPRGVEVGIFTVHEP